jgi:hypothetical protein
MSDLIAKVTKQFFGVPDGEVYPRGFVDGDEVVGDLAKVAIEEGWAEKISGDEAVSMLPSAPSATVAPVEAEGLSTASIVAGADASGAAAAIEIPDDWKTMKWFALKALAEKIAAREVKDSDDAKAVVEAEVTRRAPAQTAA